MRDAILGERVEQRAGDVVLADDVGEERGTVFSSKNLVGHLAELIVSFGGLWMVAATGREMVSMEGK